MTDKKISELVGMTSAQIANDDEIVISDTSATHTKKAPISELATFFGVNQEGIEDTVANLFTGHSNHVGIAPTYDDANGELIFSIAGGVTTAEMGFLAGTTSDIQTQFNAKAPIASPTFTGTASAPTASANDATTKIATTAYVQNELTGYASDTATFTNKAGAISQWSNDSGYITSSSTSTLTNKSGNISQWTNNTGFITGSSTEALTNKSISGSANTLTNIPYSALSSVDTDLSSVSGSHDSIASAKATKDYVDTQIQGIDTLEEASDSNISSPSGGQILVYDGTDSFDNQTSSVTLSGAVTGTANMDSSGDIAITTTIPTNTFTINGQSVALGGSATIPSVLQSGGTFTGDVILQDNVRLEIGSETDGDLAIYHDGNNSYLDERATGDLILKSSDIQVQSSSGTIGAKFKGGDAVELYYDGSKKLETASGGVGVTGNITVSGTVDGRDVATDGTKLDGIASGAEVNVQADFNATSGDALILNKPSFATVATSGSYTDLSNTPSTNLSGDSSPQLGGALDVNGHSISFGDNEKARFGNADDLEIYHDGNHSRVVDTGTGNLKLQGNNLTLNNADDSATYLGAVNGGAVNIYHNGSAKLTTTTGGVTITGDLANTSGNFTIDVAGQIYLDADGGDIQFRDGGTEFGRIYNNSGSLSMYSPIQDADIRIQGNDGGSVINCVTFDVSNAGAATFNNNVTAFSDERLKTNIKTIDNALDKVSQMRGVSFDRDGVANSGVIAQEIEKIAPELVKTADDEMGTKSVAYANTVGYLIEAIKELKERNEKLELIVNRLITEIEEK